MPLVKAKGAILSIYVESPPRAAAAKPQQQMPANPGSPTRKSARASRRPLAPLKPVAIKPKVVDEEQKGAVFGGKAVAQKCGASGGKPPRQLGPSTRNLGPSRSLVPSSIGKLPNRCGPGRIFPVFRDASAPTSKPAAKRSAMPKPVPALTPEDKENKPLSAGEAKAPANKSASSGPAKTPGGLPKRAGSDRIFAVFTDAPAPTAAKPTAKPTPAAAAAEGKENAVRKTGSAPRKALAAKPLGAKPLTGKPLAAKPLAPKQPLKSKPLRLVGVNVLMDASEAYGASGAEPAGFREVFVSTMMGVGLGAIGAARARALIASSTNQAQA